MADSTGCEGMTKLPMLSRADNFKNWHRQIKSYLQPQDVEFPGLAGHSDPGSSVQQRCWLEANVGAKSSITLTLANGPLAQVIFIVHDTNASAKDLWYELGKICRMPNSQMVINTERELEVLTIEKDE